MKKKERYKIFAYAKEQYSEIFNCNYQFRNLKKSEILKLLKEYNHAQMCEWSYCCYGLYQQCWQDLYAEGQFDLTQERVNQIIEDVVKETTKICRKDNRILYCEDKDGIHIVIIARDKLKSDFLITFF